MKELEVQRVYYFVLDNTDQWLQGMVLCKVTDGFYLVDFTDFNISSLDRIHYTADLRVVNTVSSTHHFMYSPLNLDEPSDLITIVETQEEANQLIEISYRADQVRLAIERMSDEELAEKFWDMCKQL